MDRWPGDFPALWPGRAFELIGKAPSRGPLQLELVQALAVAAPPGRALCRRRWRGACPASGAIRPWVCSPAPRSWPGGSRTRSPPEKRRDLVVGIAVVRQHRGQARTAGIAAMSATSSLRSLARVTRAPTISWSPRRASCCLLLRISRLSGSLRLLCSSARGVSSGGFGCLPLARPVRARAPPSPPARPRAPWPEPRGADAPHPADRTRPPCVRSPWAAPGGRPHPRRRPPRHAPSDPRCPA